MFINYHEFLETFEFNEESFRWVHKETCEAFVAYCKNDKSDVELVRE